MSTTKNDDARDQVKLLDDHINLMPSDDRLAVRNAIRRIQNLIGYEGANGLIALAYVGACVAAEQ